MFVEDTFVNNSDFSLRATRIASVVAE